MPDRIIDLGNVRGLPGEPGAPGRDGRDGMPAQIAVAASVGTEVTLTLGETELSGFSETGVVIFNVTQYGVWKITAGNVTKKLAVDAVKQYSIYISGAKTFGVEWDYGNPSTQLRRLQPSDDPNGYVTIGITEEPHPAVGNGTGSSPFDAFAPWNGMVERNVRNNALSYQATSASFSRSEYDTVVRIPGYYYKIVDDPEKKLRQFYISDVAREGFALHPGSNKWVGKYKTSVVEEEHVTKNTNVVPTGNLTRAQFRTGAVAKGDKWSLLDIATRGAILLLYLVEFADWDSQKVIGKDCTYADDYIAVGDTDSMNYHTGYAGVNGECNAQYRHIEGLWGNKYEWIDGINVNNYDVLICTDRSVYEDNTAEGYTDTGISIRNVGGYISELDAEGCDWAFIPTKTNGSSTTYVPDYAYSYSGWRVVCAGGYYYVGGSVGLFFFDASSAASNHGDSIGARLLFNP